MFDDYRRALLVFHPSIRLTRLAARRFAITPTHLVSGGVSRPSLPLRANEIKIDRRCINVIALSGACSLTQLGFKEIKGFALAEATVPRFQRCCNVTRSSPGTTNATGISRFVSQEAIRSFGGTCVLPLHRSRRNRVYGDFYNFVLS